MNVSHLLIKTPSTRESKFALSLCFIWIVTHLFTDPLLSEETTYIFASDGKNQQILRVEVTAENGEIKAKLLESLKLPSRPSGITYNPHHNQLIVSSSARSSRKAEAVNIKILSDGKLKPDHTTTIEFPTSYTSVDRKGKFYLSTHYRTGSTQVYHLNQDGRVGQQACSLKTPRPEAHSLLTTRDNKFAYIPCVKTNNALYQYSFDEKTGKLSPLKPFDASPPAMFGPRHLAYHPTLPLVYFSNEQQLGVSVYEINSDGQLHDKQHAVTIPRRSPYVRGKRELSSSDIVMASDGKLLFIAIRDSAGEEDSVFTFRVESDGRLSLASRMKVGDIPWKLALSPNGKILFVSESNESRLSIFEVQPDGSLKTAAQINWNARIRSMVAWSPTKYSPPPEEESIKKVRSATPAVIDDYRRYISGDRSVVAWYGKRVALVLDEDTSIEQRDAKTMQRILFALDDVFDAFDKVTGRKPRLTAPLQGKIRIEVSSKVGGGLAHHGRLGVAIGHGFFEGLYKRFSKGENTVDQVFFYEIARNYWMRDMNPTIDYHTSKGPRDYGWWTVGFNNAMSIFLPHEIKSIKDMYYFGSGGKRFSDGMEANLKSYIQNPDKYNWENSWNVPLVPWKKRTSVNDLMTGLLIRLHRDHGGIEFIKGLYQEIPKLQPLKSRSDRQGARDNFYEASSRAAKKDLSEFFTKTLRWSLTEKRVQEVRNALNK